MPFKIFYKRWRDREPDLTSYEYECEKLIHKYRYDRTKKNLAALKEGFAKFEKEVESALNYLKKFPNYDPGLQMEREWFMDFRVGFLKGYKEELDALVNPRPARVIPQQLESKSSAKSPELSAAAKALNEQRAQLTAKLTRELFPILHAAKGLSHAEMSGKPLEEELIENYIKKTLAAKSQPIVDLSELKGEERSKAALENQVSHVYNCLYKLSFMAAEPYARAEAKCPKGASVSSSTTTTTTTLNVKVYEPPIAFYGS